MQCGRTLVTLRMGLLQHVKPALWAQVSTDWVGLIDEWALRFFDELDYRREAQNSELFSRQMSHLEGISVSQVFPRLSSRDVLTTAWVQGGHPHPVRGNCCMERGSLLLTHPTSLQG